MTELNSRYIKRHEDWMNTNVMKISVDKWKAHSWEKNSLRCQYELGTDQFSRSPARKDLGVKMGAQKDNECSHWKQGKDTG